MYGINAMTTTKWDINEYHVMWLALANTQTDLREVISPSTISIIDNDIALIVSDTVDGQACDHIFEETTE